MEYVDREKKEGTIKIERKGGTIKIERKEGTIKLTCILS